MEFRNLKNSKNYLPDIVIVPLLAFDDKKNRLGYGKGFYDRYLNKLKKLNKKMEAIGVAFSFQNYKKIPSSKYDFKLNSVFTEKGFFVMRILLLGDICGPAGMQIIKLKLKKIIEEKKIDFTIANGENAADNGKGITKKNFKRIDRVRC